MMRALTGGVLLLCFAGVGLTPNAVAGPATTPACSDSWDGGNGSWNTAADWSTGDVPNGAANVCITAAGSYTVTLDGGDEGVNSLSLGGTSGTQTLLLISTNDLESTINFNVDSQINPNGTLTLESNETGGTGSPSKIASETASLTNDGTLSTSGDYQDVIAAGLTNAVDGTVSLNGTTNQIGDYRVANNGKFSVGSGASCAMDETLFTQAAGTIDNEGTLSNTGYASQFNQNGGTDKGNAIQLTGSVAFDDTAGTGGFVLTNENTIAGTVPKGQTVTMTSSDTTETQTEIVSPGLTNKGKLVMTSTGATAEPDQFSSSGGSLTNDAVLDLTGAKAETDYLGAMFTNAASGTIDVASPGAFLGNLTDTNSGKLVVATGDSLSLNGATLNDTSTASTTVSASATDPLASIVEGTLHLAGSLNVTTIGKPSVGKVFQPITSDALTGKFSKLTSGSQAYKAGYTSTTVSLTAAFSASGKSFKTKPKKTGKFVVAAFTNAVKGMKAKISWGDKKSSTGAVSFSGSKGTVAGTHKYAKAGTYKVTIVLTEDGVTQTVTGKAKVSS